MFTIKDVSLRHYAKRVGLSKLLTCSVLRKSSKNFWQYTVIRPLFGILLTSRCFLTQTTVRYP